MVLSVPAVLVPGTRVGAMAAGALITGGMIGKGDNWWIRALAGRLIGVLLGLGVSVAAWDLLTFGSPEASWQVTTRNIVTNSTVAILDDAIGSWLDGFEAMEGNLLHAQFMSVNLLLGLLGGSLGGWLASSNAPRSVKLGQDDYAADDSVLAGADDPDGEAESSAEGDVTTDADVSDQPALITTDEPGEAAQPGGEGGAPPLAEVVEHRTPTSSDEPVERVDSIAEDEAIPLVDPGNIQTSFAADEADVEGDSETESKGNPTDNPTEEA